MKNIASTTTLVLVLAACSGNNPDPEVATGATEAPRTAASAASTYTLPAKDTNSVITDISATRNSSGAVVISGSTLLPPGTKLGVERRSPAGKTEGRSNALVDGTGNFYSEPFSDNGNSPKQGPQEIGLVSYFTEVWQPESVLSLTGIGGANLSPMALKADDPEFPDAGKHLDESRTVTFPPIPEDVIAINEVKSARLYVQGKGRASETIGEIVAYWENFPGYSMSGWSAKQDAEKWTVTLGFETGAESKEAQWEYDPATGEVKYLDPMSKILSWMPAE